MILVFIKIHFSTSNRFATIKNLNNQWVKFTWIWRLEQNGPSEFTYLFLCMLFLHYAFCVATEEIDIFFQLTNAMHFSIKLLLTRCSSWTYKCAFSVPLPFKYSNSNDHITVKTLPLCMELSFWHWSVEFFNQQIAEYYM